jgi:hypothetical protein
MLFCSLPGEGDKGLLNYFFEKSKAVRPERAVCKLSPTLHFLLGALATVTAAGLNSCQCSPYSGPENGEHRSHPQAASTC